MVRTRMDLATILETLRRHEAELRAAGIARLGVFGSQARREATEESDVDLVAVIDPDTKIGSRGMDQLERRLAALLGTDADLVREPIWMNARLQAEIDRDRVVAF